MVGRLYGNKYGGDALWNIRVGFNNTQVSFRFLAKDTVAVNKVRFFNTYSSKPGYHAGNGGKILVEIREDDTTPFHYPIKTSIAQAKMPFPLKESNYPLLEFDKTVVLTKGKLYHLVFSNYDVTPDLNHVSVNTMFVQTPKPFGTTDHPDVVETDMTVLWRNKYNEWKRFKDDLSVTPIFTLYHELSEIGVDNVSVPGYGGMESWRSSPKVINGPNMVRQRFTPPFSTEVGNVAVRLKKIGTPNNLNAQLFRGNEKIAEGSLDFFKAGDIMDWVKVDLAGALTVGVEHFLVLSSDNSELGRWETFPIRDGSSFGFCSTWDKGYSEYSNDGKNWSAWDIWGNTNVKLGDLQMYFNSKGL